MKYKDYLLEDFLKDEFFKSWVLGLDPESNFFWEKWISEHPEKQDLVLKARELITSISYQNEYNATSKEYLEVLENIYKRSEKPVTRRWFNAPWLHYAAILILTTIGAFIFIRYYNIEETKQMAYEAEPEFNTVKNPKGKKNLLKFPDGSQIKLNSSTTLKYPKAFAKNIREVYLEGEAFFDIARDTLRPFIIHTDSLQVTVLGTSFNVQAYPDRNQIQVTVASGKVQVYQQESGFSSENSVVLEKNEAAVYERGNTKISKEKVTDLQEIISWKDGVLTFRKASFSEIIDELEKWYDVEFIVEKGVNVGGKFNGSFDNTSLEMVLEGIGFSTNFKYQINGNQIVISK